MNTELAMTPPALYRSEAFLEDLDPSPLPMPVKRESHSHRFAGWLVAVPGAVAALASAAMLAGLPA